MKNNKNDAMREKLLMKPKLKDALLNLNQDRSNPDLWYAYGMALAEAGKSEDALDAFSQGLIQNPFNATLYFGRGRKCIGMKNYWMALADLTMAIRLDPSVYSHWYYRGVVNNLNGCYSEAIADFKRAMETTELYERYGLVDWLFTTYVEMGDKQKAKEILDTIPDDLTPPKMHYGYKRRVQLYKGIIAPEQLIDSEEIKAKCVVQENRMALEIATLLFGLYIYYVYIGNDAGANETLIKLMDNPYPNAFACIKGEDAARKRELIK
jgi:tetratricopeptide (TPR) repeat protein